MSQPALALLAALLTYLVSLAAGTLLLRHCTHTLSRSEERFLGFVLGSSLLSLSVFLITAAGLARTEVFLFLACAFILLGLRKKAFRPSPVELPSLTRPQRFLFWIPYTAFTGLYLVNALAPEISADALAYHLALPLRYLREGGFPRITSDMYAGFPQGLEMLFLLAISIGGKSAAAMVHFLYLSTLPFGMLAFARRNGIPMAGIAGSLLVYLSPVVARTGTAAYVDVALAAALFGLFHLVWLHRNDLKISLVVPIGLLAGFAVAIKYTGFLAVPYALWGLLSPRRARSWAIIRTALACCVIMILPWLIKNFVVVRNPIAPFGNALFQNPYMNVASEESYALAMRTFNQVTYPEIPMEVTARGSRLLGLLGPLFLLTPVALAGLGNPVARSILFPGLLFLLLYPLNIGTRFLIPALPFLSLALGMVFARFPPAAAALVLLHAVLSWPAVVTLYAAPHAWRIESFPWRAALRLQPEAEFLRQNIDDYDLGLLLERLVPPDQTVFSPSASMQAVYHSRNILVGHNSAKGERLKFSLWTPIYPQFQPSRRYEFHLPEPSHRLRLVQTSSLNPRDDQWSVSELHALSGGVEIPPENLRLKAEPNPWDVLLAADGNLTTRWISGRSYLPGMHLELELSGGKFLEDLIVDCTGDQGHMTMALSYWSGSGDWRTAPGGPAFREISLQADLRRAATQFLKKEGVRWLVIADDGNEGKDFLSNRHAWPVIERGRANRYTVYEIP